MRNQQDEKLKINFMWPNLEFLFWVIKNTEIPMCVKYFPAGRCTFKTTRVSKATIDYIVLHHCDVPYTTCDTRPSYFPMQHWIAGIGPVHEPSDISHYNKWHYLRKVKYKSAVVKASLIICTYRMSEK